MFPPHCGVCLSVAILLDVRFCRAVACEATIGQRAAGGGGWPLGAAAALPLCQMLLKPFLSSSLSSFNNHATRIDQAFARGAGQKLVDGLRTAPYLRLAPFFPITLSLGDSQPYCLAVIDIDLHTRWIALQMQHHRDSYLVSPISITSYLNTAPRI